MRSTVNIVSLGLARGFTVKAYPHVEDEPIEFIDDDGILLRVWPDGVYSLKTINTLKSTNIEERHYPFKDDADFWRHYRDFREWARNWGFL